MCSQLLFASTSDIDTLPKRQADSFAIARQNLILEEQFYKEHAPLIIELEDGYEKRHLLKCKRCNLIVAYHLDGIHGTSTQRKQGPNEGVIYLRLAGLQSTEALEADK